MLWSRMSVRVLLAAFLVMASGSFAYWSVSPELPAALAAEIQGKGFAWGCDCFPFPGGCTLSNWCNAARVGQSCAAPHCIDPSTNETCSLPQGPVDPCWDDTPGSTVCYGKLGTCISAVGVGYTCNGSQERLPACGSYIDCWW